jgi:hypothetical protein
MEGVGGLVNEAKFADRNTLGPDMLLDLLVVPSMGLVLRVLEIRILRMNGLRMLHLGVRSRGRNSKQRQKNGNEDKLFHGPNVARVRSQGEHS